MESLCGSINGDYGELDWMPLRYIHRNVARRRLPGLYLQMPLEERQNRHQKLIERIRSQDVHWWRKTFLKALAVCDTD